ncbi:MAG: hypothetical protein ABW032_10540 [Burkholderiaceae bacterium]
MQGINWLSASEMGHAEKWACRLDAAGTDTPPEDGGAGTAAAPPPPQAESADASVSAQKIQAKEDHRFRFDMRAGIGASGQRPGQARHDVVETSNAVVSAERDPRCPGILESGPTF